MQTIQSPVFISEIVKKQKAFFRSGKTKNLNFRIEQIKKLNKLVQQHEEEIYDALNRDLNKPHYESMMVETGPFYTEIKHTLKHIREWATPEIVPTSLFNTPGASKIIREPYGNVLIIAPWNYPFQLTFSPLIGAMAAGNCAVLKPSEHAPHTSAIMKKIINQHFDEGYIHVVEGGVKETQELLNERWDYIFFTGGPEVGRIIYQAAAKHLTPVTLELGGKSPCIVHKDANINLAAKRIAWGKWINSGQTCLAPDYLFVHAEVKDKLVDALKNAVNSSYGNDIINSSDYCKIINEKHYNRLKGYLNDGEILFGGKYDDEKLKIEPTLLFNPPFHSTVMTEEIFGPILPIYAYNNFDEVIDFVNSREKPLAAYLFSRSNEIQKKFLEQISCGGVTINDTVLHISSSEMPFGGVGESGIGGYHGKYSFDTFSHKKSVLYRGPQPLDNYLRFPPYKQSRFKLMKSLLKRFL
jgi:aldehyde dehydrogenase (NAD+)